MLLHGTRCLLVWVLLDDALNSAVATLCPPQQQKDALLLQGNPAYFLSSRSNGRVFLAAQTAEAPRPESATTTTTAGNGAEHVLASPRTTSNTIEPTTEATAPGEADSPAIGSEARGRELLSQGSFREAAAVLEQAVSATGAEPTALLFLAEAYQELGQPHKAVETADQLLTLDIPIRAKSFVLNRRGICLRRIGDLAGARESYELAVRDGLDNRHAMYNLAHLLHYTVFPRSPHDFSVLLRAVELYRGALGRRDSSASMLPAMLSAAGAATGSGGRESTANGDGIGGPLNILSVYNDLADALVQAGRNGEAASELERALALVDGGTGRGGGKGNGADETSWEGDRKEEAFLWDTLRRARDSAGDYFGAVAAGKNTPNTTFTVRGSARCW